MKNIEAWSAVAEVEPGYVRLRLGAPGHQHRILFATPLGHEESFRRAMLLKRGVRLLIEVPALEMAPEDEIVACEQDIWQAEQAIEMAKRRIEYLRAEGPWSSASTASTATPEPTAPRSPLKP